MIGRERAALLLLAFLVTLVGPQVAGAIDCSDYGLEECVKRGEVEDSVRFEVSSQRTGYYKAKFTPAPASPELDDWRERELSSSYMYRVRDIYSIGFGGSRVLFRREADMDVSDLSSGTYIASVWTCEVGQFPRNCEWMVPRVFEKTENQELIEYQVLDASSVDDLSIFAESYEPSFDIQTDADSVTLVLDHWGTDQTVRIPLSTSEPQEEVATYTADVSLQEKDISGIYNVSLELREGSRMYLTDPIQTLAAPMKRPEIEADLTGDGIHVEASKPEGTDYADLKLDASVVNRDGDRVESFIGERLDCEEECSHTFEYTPDQTVYITVLGQLVADVGSVSPAKGRKVATELTNGDPYIEEVNGMRDEERTLLEGETWQETFEVKGSPLNPREKVFLVITGASPSDVDDVYLTHGGDRFGTVSSSAEGWEASFNGADLSRTPENVSVNIVFDDSTATYPLPGTFSTAPDTVSPELVNDRVIRYEDGDPVIQFKVEERGSSEVEVGVSFNAVDEDTLQTCHISIPESEDAGSGSCRFSLPDDISITRATVHLKDGSGNVAETAIDPVFVNPSRVLEEYEVNGDPRDKINVLIFEREWEDDSAVGGFRDRLDRNVDDFFNRGGAAVDDYRDYFNWYLITFDGRICESSQCSDDSYKFDFSRAGALVQSDTLKGANAMVAFLTEEQFGGASFGKLAIIGSQFQYPDHSQVFRHELFHSIWGFADEYDTYPATQDSKTTSEAFFPKGQGGYDLGKHQNIWHSKEACEEETQYYNNFDPDDCVKQVEEDETDEDHPGFVLDAGNSLMGGYGMGSATVAEHHMKRIEHLMENNPWYTDE